MRGDRSLQLHRIAPPARKDRDPAQLTSRLYLKVRVHNAAYDASYCPVVYDGVIDTGAEVSIVPRKVLESLGGLNNVWRGSEPVALYAFDGRSPDGPNPSFRVHFELTGLEPGARRRSAVVMTREVWKEPLLAVTGTCRACGIDGEPHDIVLLGMDFLARCTLRLSGPTNEQVLTLHADRG